MDDRYRKALNAALADVTADPEVIGVLFTGSVQQGRPQATSGGLDPAQAVQIVEHVLAPVGGRLQLWESKKVTYLGGQ